MLPKQIINIFKSMAAKLDIPFVTKVNGFVVTVDLTGNKPLLFAWDKHNNQIIYEVVLDKGWWNGAPTKADITNVFLTALEFGHIPISIEVNHVSYFFRDCCPEYMVTTCAANREVKLIKHHGYV